MNSPLHTIELKRTQTAKLKRTQTAKRRPSSEFIQLDFGTKVQPNDENGECDPIIQGIAKLDHLVHKLGGQLGEQVWQPRRIIATFDRVYILLQRDPSADHFEVADYLPLDEVRGVCRIDPETLKNPTKQIVNLSKSHSRHLKNREATGMKVEEEVPLTVQIAPASPPPPPGDSPEGAGRRRDISLRDFSPAAVFEISTAADGFNQGKKFCFSTPDDASCDAWIQTVTELSTVARAAFERKHRLELFQRRVRRFYEADWFQGLMGLAIASNFILTIAQIQIKNDDLNSTFDGIDYAFTALFSLELCINFAGSAVVPFFRDPWNWFDAGIVLSSVVILAATIGNNSLIKQMRILRTFRVLRAFRRFGDFRSIINSITASILPGLQALIIGLIVVALYGTIGVQYFGPIASDSFGDFFHAFYTLFGVVAYARWPEESLPPFDGQGRPNIGVLVYLYSYVVIVLFVLLQVVVAVVLGNFFKSSAREKEAAARAVAAAEESKQSLSKPFEALLDALVLAFDTADDLDDRLGQLFRQFDVDDSGRLSAEEMSEGVHKFDPAATGRFNLEDFHRITENGRLCRADGELDVPAFAEVMRREVKRFGQRQAADALFTMEPPPDMAALLAAAKLHMVEMGQAEEAAAARGARLGELAAAAEAAARAAEGHDDERRREADAAREEVAGRVADRAGRLRARLDALLARTE